MTMEKKQGRIPGMKGRIRMTDKIPCKNKIQ